MPTPAAVLRGLPLLSSLPQVTLEHMAQHSSEQAFAKREIVLNKNSPAQALCFLFDGRLQGVDFTSDGREVGIYFIQPGDYFGEVAVIDSDAQPEFVTAVSRSRVVFIPKDLIKPILFAYPKLAEVLCTNLAVRLRQMSAQRRILGLANPLQRVCAQLELLLHTKNGHDYVVPDRKPLLPNERWPFSLTKTSPISSIPSFLRAQTPKDGLFRQIFVLRFSLFLMQKK